MNRSARLTGEYSFVMNSAINRDAVGEAFAFFGGAPRFSNQTYDAVSEHRERVIETENGIKATLFDFSLASRGCLAPFDLDVLSLREKMFHVFWIVRILIRSDDGIWVDHRVDVVKQSLASFGPSIFARTVLRESPFCQPAAGIHGADFKAENESGFSFNRNMD